MKRNIKLLLTIACILPCEPVSWRRQLEHVVNTRLQNLGLNDLSPSRRFYQFDPRELSSILGVPSQASHLPAAEPIHPGHTLLKPTLGMLKSAVKFPHKEMEDGAGVYGNIENLGIRYDARNERVLYSGFRRSPSDYIMVIPSKYSLSKKPRVNIASVVLDLERKGKAKSELLKILKRLNRHKGTIWVVSLDEGISSKLNAPVKKDISYYLNTNKDPVFADLLESRHKKILRSYLDENDYKIDSQNAILNSKEDRRIKKFNWLNKSKDLYNNIKVNQEAPEIDELLPTKQDEELRKWWYYNADDYKTFDE